jgi:hypothetical protein
MGELGWTTSEVTQEYLQKLVSQGYMTVVTPHVTKLLIKFLKLQLSPNARLNQDNKVWNRIQRQRFKISSSI